MSLVRRTLVGVLWSGAGQLGSNVARFATIALLGLWLPPPVFGLFALAVLVVGSAQKVSELGLLAAVVQKPEADEPTLSTAFWMNLAMSVLLGLVVFSASGPVAGLFGDQRLEPIVEALAWVFPLDALAVVPRAMLTRDLRFRDLSVRLLLGELAFGAVAIGATLAGREIWGLVAALILQRLVLTGSLWWLVPWRPHWVFDRTSAAKLLLFGGPFLASALVLQLAGFLDHAIVGVWLGTAGLGYYHFAAQTSIVPLQRLVGLVARVVFPAMSRVQADPTRLARAFQAGTQHLLAAILPAAMLAIFVGPWFLRALYGQKWEASTEPLRILSVGGAFFAFDLAQAYFLAIGRPGVRLGLHLLRLAGFLAGLAVFARVWGVTASSVAAAVSLGIVVHALVGWVLAARRLGIPVGSLGAVAAPAIRGCAGALVPVVAYELSGSPGSPWVATLGLPIAMAVGYLAATTGEYRALAGRVAGRVARGVSVHSGRRSG